MTVPEKSERPPPARARIVNRRHVLAGALALSTGLAGCQTNEVDAEIPERPDETVTTDAPSETAATSTPTLNETQYPVAWQWDVKGGVLDDDVDSRVGLLVGGDWRSAVETDILSETGSAFVSETEFDSEAVIVLEASVSAGLNRLILRSVDGVGTSGVTLSVEEWESESGLNNAPHHLLLVRIPNQGTEPTSATATIDFGEESKTVSTDD